jgi:hypothetical protein
MSQVQDLLAKQMSRKEFLRFFLMAILALFGVTNFLNFLTKNSKRKEVQDHASQSTAKGFGSRKFGV